MHKIVLMSYEVSVSRGLGQNPLLWGVTSNNLKYLYLFVKVNIKTWGKGKVNQHTNAFIIHNELSFLRTSCLLAGMKLTVHCMLQFSKTNTTPNRKFRP